MHNSVSQTRSEIIDLLHDQELLTQLPGTLYAGNHGELIQVVNRDETAGMLDLYEQEQPGVVTGLEQQRTATASQRIAGLLHNETMQVDRRAAELAVSNAGVVRATNEYWQRLPEELGRNAQTMQSIVARNSKTANGSFNALLVEGNKPQPASDNLDPRKPDIVVAVESWWRTLGASNNDARLAPALVRGALIILRDSQNERPIDKHRDEITELDAIAAVHHAITSGEQQVADSNHPESNTIRVAEVATGAEMLLDAAFCSHDVRYKGRLFREASQLFSIVANSEHASAQEKLFAMGHAADIAAFAIGSQLAKAYKQGDAAAASQLRGRYTEEFVRSVTQINTLLKNDAVADGFSNEVVTNLLLRAAMIEKDIIVDGYTRLAVGREDAAHDGLKSRNVSLNHDLILQVGGNTERLQLKSYLGAQNTYHPSITVMEGRDVIPLENQQAGSRSYAKAQQELLQVLAIEAMRKLGKRVPDLTPRQKVIKNHASAKIAEHIHIAAL